MIETFRMALAIPSSHHRRRIWWSVPFAILVAAIEAAGFGLLYLVLNALGDDDALRSGPLGVLRDITGVHDPSAFRWLLGSMIVALLAVKGCAAVTLLWWQTSVLASAEAETASELFEAYLHAPLTFHLETNSAAMIRDVQVSTMTVYQDVLFGLISVTTELAVISLIAAVVLVSDPPVALLAAALMAVAAGVFLKVLGRRSRQFGRQNMQMARTVHQLLAEGIHGTKVLQVLNRQDDVSKHFRETREDWSRSRRAIVFINQLPRYYLELVLLFGVAAIGLGATALNDGQAAAATIGLLVAAALRMIPSLNKILSGLNKAQVGRFATKDIHRQLRMVEQLRSERVEASSSAPVPFEESVEIRNVTFTYAGATVPALDDVNLVIDAGESVGIVGASGSGKTTLANVILGLLQPQAGEIVVDGTVLTTPRLPGWRRQIGYVPQDIFLSDTSLRRNVAFGVPDDEIDDDRVLEALRMALLGDFVDSLPKGLETRTGEHGDLFSGGQRQRVGIARALYPRPRFLLLDEATSALDGVTEAQVAATIDALHGTVTMAIVAHRLSTVRNCDRIVLMSEGRIDRVGAFGDLVETDPRFAEMVRRASSL